MQIMCTLIFFFGGGGGGGGVRGGENFFEEIFFCFFFGGGERGHDEGGILFLRYIFSLSFSDITVLILLFTKNCKKSHNGKIC